MLLDVPAVAVTVRFSVANFLIMLAVLILLCVHTNAGILYRVPDITLCNAESSVCFRPSDDNCYQQVFSVVMAMAIWT